MKDINKVKRLYTFQVPLESEVEELQTEKDSKTGEDIKVMRKVKKKVNRTFFLKKPNRKLWDEADKFNAIEISTYIKAGLLTRIQLAKRFDDDGGAFSKKEEVRYKKACENYANIIKEEIEINKAAKKTKKQEARLVDINIEKQVFENAIQEYDMAINNIYSQTAEYKANTRTTLWWVLFLACEEKDGGYNEIFGTEDEENDNFNARLEKYDQIEENNDDYMMRVFNDFVYLVSLWFIGSVKEEKDFDDFFQRRKKEIADAKNNQ